MSGPESSKLKVQGSKSNWSGELPKSRNESQIPKAKSHAPPPKALWRTRKNPKVQISKIGFVVVLALSSGATLIVSGATNSADDEFKLRPPRAEVLPSFWEQNGKWIVPVAIAGVLVVGLLLWYLTRSKPMAQVPPEVRAKKELEALGARAADREALSRTSQVLKRYLAEVFDLPREEMTTAEFCKALKARTEPGERLSNEVCDFLRRSDQMKFAPGTASVSTVPEAVKLLEQAEARRAELRTAQANTAAPRMPEVAKS